MNKRLRGSLLIIAGLALIITAGWIFSLNEREEALAASNTEVLLEQMHEEIEANKNIYDTEGKLAEFDLGGHRALGILNIPSLGLELPVLDDWSYEMLIIAPGRYFGRPEEGNLILLGHNYKRHFARLKDLQPGDRAELYTLDGITYTYEFEMLETLEKTALEELVGSDAHMTIFTCTVGGERRVTARFNMVDAVMN